MILKCLLTLSVVAFLASEIATRFSHESIAGFLLSVTVGIFGWLGFEKGRGTPINFDKVFATVGMALCAGYIMDAFTWWREYHTELRAVCVASASYFSEPLLMFVYVNRVKLFKKIFGNDRSDASKDG